MFTLCISRWLAETYNRIGPRKTSGKQGKTPHLFHWRLLPLQTVEDSLFSTKYSLVTLIILIPSWCPCNFNH